VFEDTPKAYTRAGTQASTCAHNTQHTTHKHAASKQAKQQQKAIRHQCQCHEYPYLMTTTHVTQPSIAWVTDTVSPDFNSGTSPFRTSASRSAPRVSTNVCDWRSTSPPKAMFCTRNTRRAPETRHNTSPTKSSTTRSSNPVVHHHEPPTPSVRTCHNRAPVPCKHCETNATRRHTERF